MRQGVPAIFFNAHFPADDVQNIANRSVSLPALDNRVLPLLLGEAGSKLEFRSLYFIKQTHLSLSKLRKN